MLKVIKKRVIEYLISLPPKSVKLGQINVLIQTNNYFSKESWIKKFKENIRGLKNINLIFVKNKIDLFRAINFCQAAFIFSLSDFLIEYISKLKIIYLGIAGQDNLEFNLNTQTKLFSSKGIASKAIAEYVVAMTISILNNFNCAFENKINKKWEQSNIIRNEFVSLQSFKIGVLGVGCNGKQIAYLFNKLGCEVYGCDKSKSEDVCYIKHLYTINEIIPFLKNIDILILSLPLTKSTKGFINYELMEKYLKGKIIINVSRGEIINQKDLKKALKNQILKAAVLDVFDKEPLPWWDSLWRYKNVIITPHIAGNINRFRSTIQIDFIQKLKNEFGLNDDL